MLSSRGRFALEREGVRSRLDPFLETLVLELVKANPARLGHIDARRILFVAGSARLDSRASIRPLTFGGSPPGFVAGTFVKPKIAIGDRVMLYEICLRPRFFLRSTAEERLAILAHELWHIAPAFDGTLARDRRHDTAAKETIEEEAKVIARATIPSPARDMLAYTGELELAAWLSRPPSRIPLLSSLRRDYDERDLCVQVIAQRG
jgi:hypothetical protein